MTGAIGPRRQAAPVKRPEGFAPDYDAFEPRFRKHEEVVLIIFGIEKRGGDDRSVRQRLVTALGREGGPELLERGVVKDGFGPKSDVWFAYWLTTDSYEDWRRSSGIEDLFGDPALLSGGVGLWREFCHVSLDHNETSYSRNSNITGIANLCDALEVTPVHGYWGSARDRMVAAVSSELQGQGRPGKIAPEATLGKRVRVEAPHNSCLIKTTQDLNLATDEQISIYRNEVEPALHTGLRFLRENPVETGCIGMRFIEEAAGDRVTGLRTLGVGYFASLGALEAWTHHHSTHQEILSCFVNMVGRFNGQPGLHLWHEVTVFEAGRLKGDYVNCSPDGTLLQVER